MTDSDTAKVTQIKSMFADLSSEGKQEVKSTILGPTQVTADLIWKIIIIAFSIVLVGSFLTLAISIFVAPAPTGIQTILTVFTSVVTFMAGLLSPSPVKNNGS